MSVIAIDGPSGVGKSSTAKEVARRLGYQYLDTGAMYRAMAWLCLNRGVTDPVDVLEQIRGADLEITLIPDEFFVSSRRHRRHRGHPRGGRVRECPDRLRRHRRT